MFGYTTFAQAPYASLGGNSFTAALSESASAASALFVLRGLGGIVDESATATDIPTAVRTLLVALAETASGSDSLVARIDALATLSDSAAMLDLTNAIATLNPTINGFQLYVLPGNVLVWVRVDDSQNPNWQPIRV